MTVPKEKQPAEATIRAFFEAMNAQDADAAAALTREDVTFAIGPNELSGREVLRELATQVDEQLSVELVPLTFEKDSPGSVSVSARRIERWRSTGETAAEQDVAARFTLDPDGTIARVELA
jgi:ketosteroid isomerase-like protein